MKINLFFESSCQVLAFAAQELERYLRKMLLDRNGELNYYFSVECNESRKNDAFSICADDFGGKIIGNSERAVLLGVYEYLHCLGARFLGPNSEIIP